MDADQLRRLYDAEYAAQYEGRFLTSELSRSDAEHELHLLSRWLVPGSRWLDVACGTGYFLARFPEIERAGLDLSPAMLQRARAANPGVPLLEGSYLDPHPEWNDRWDLVSCMWYAYGLVSTMAEVERLVANLAAWTAPDGRCFLPIADPRLIAGVDLPWEIRGVWPGTVRITGILWSYEEDDGQSVHQHQIAPQVDVMRDLMGRHFREVEQETYPPAMPGWEGRRTALVGRGRKALGR